MAIINSEHQFLESLLKMKSKKISSTKTSATLVKEIEDEKTGELLKFNHPMEAFNYTMDTRKRAPELEPLIATDPEAIWSYFNFVLNGTKWRKGEQAISKDGFWAAEYATKILKDRFKEGERAIKKRPDATKNYLEFLVDEGIFTVEQADNFG